MLPEHPYLCLPAQHSFLPPSFPDCDHSSCRTGVKTPTAPPGVTRQLCVTLHPTIILPLSASFVALIFLLPAHWVHLGLHPSVLPAGLLGNSPLHLPLNPAPHLLILLLIMSICSLWAKQLLTRVIQFILLCAHRNAHMQQPQHSNHLLIARILDINEPSRNQCSTREKTTSRSNPAV